MRSIHTIVAAGVVSVCVAGCAGRPMDSSLPVQIDTSPGGARYLQEGKSVDAGSLRRYLRREPETAGKVNGSLAAGITGIIFGATGGALIGWPLGRAAAGDKAPPWNAAGVGAGFVAAGLVLTLVSLVVMDSAVETHNRRFTSQAWWPSPSVARPPRRVGRARDPEPPLVPYADSVRVGKAF